MFSRKDIIVLGNDDLRLIFLGAGNIIFRLWKDFPQDNIGRVLP